MAEIRKETIHRMGRRCREWDYSGRAIYLVTVCLRERGRPVLAEWPQDCAGAETTRYVCRPTALGEKVLACWRRVPEFWPQVELLECQLMPDHFHGLLFVRENLPVSGQGENPAVSGRAQDNRRVSAPAQNPERFCASPETAKRKTLGDIVRGFKTGCREAGWEEGYVDNILFREGQLRREVEYLRDNPRRLYEKRANPELFKRVLDLPLDLAVSGEAQNNLAVSGEAQNKQGFCAGAETRRFQAHFQALGNTALLRRPLLVQVQCSRSDFRYRREKLPGGGWKILRDSAGAPLVEYASPAFEERCADVLRCAGNGAVVVSPCLSHGEREIARRAHEAGASVIALRNKSFARFEKPAGRLFDDCARGNLLLLAPAAWPWVPGEKPPTRESSLVLNRIAQLLCDEYAADIDYKGATIPDVDAKVKQALSKTGDLP